MRHEGLVVLAEWLAKVNAETRTYMGVVVGPELTEYTPPPDKVHRARREARVYLDGLTTDEQAAACAAADVARVRERRAGRAADWTVEALMFALRRGLDAIKHPDNQRRLRELNDTQLREVAARLQAFMPHIAPAWKPADVEILISIWSKLQ